MWREFLESIGIRTSDYLDDNRRPTWTINYNKSPLQWFFWALFGNDDNGQDEVGYNFVTWWLRNPCHNLTKYVFGFGHGKLEYSSGSRYPSFPGRARVDYLRCKSHPTSILPRNQWFPFFHGSFFYWGWRSDGTFGIKVKL